MEERAGCLALFVFLVSRDCCVTLLMGAQWLSGRVLDSRPKGRGFEPHRRHCVVSLSKNINPSLVLVQPRKTRPYLTERLLMGRKESNQTNNLPRDATDCLQFVSVVFPDHTHLLFLKTFWCD